MNQTAPATATSTPVPLAAVPDPLTYPLPPNPELTPDQWSQVWARLTRPFPADWIELLPKPSRNSQPGNCNVCGKYHKLPAAHVEYVGHARVTKWLNDIVGPWNWALEPYRVDPDRPAMIVEGGRASLTAHLTILGVRTPMPEVGCADTGKDEWQKDLLGDALKRCAMRLGVGLDLWIKGDSLSATDQPADEPVLPPPAPAVGSGRPVSPPPAPAPAGPRTPAALRKWVQDNPISVMSTAQVGLFVQEWFAGFEIHGERSGKWPPGSLGRALEKFRGPGTRLEGLPEADLREFASRLITR